MSKIVVQLLILLELVKLSFLIVFLLLTQMTRSLTLDLIKQVPYPGFSERNVIKLIPICMCATQPN